MIDGYWKVTAIAGGVLTQLLGVILILDVGDVGDELLKGRCVGKVRPGARPRLN